MEEFTMLSWGLGAKTLTFCVAAVSVYYMLHYYDKRNEIKWGENYAKLMESSMGVAIYFGARIIAITALAGAIYS